MPGHFQFAQQPRSANTSGTPDPGTATRASSRAKRRAPTIVLADQPRDTTARQDSAEGEPTQEWDSAQQEEQEEQKEPADTDEVSTASKRRMARSHALTGLRPDVKNDLPKRAIVRIKPRVIIPAPRNRPAPARRKPSRWHRDATNVEAAATAYLEFRNLLPFATVDAGDRSGHGETPDGSAVQTFDEKSLSDAAGLQATALSEGADEASRALEEAGELRRSPARRSSPSCSRP